MTREHGSQFSDAWYFEPAGASEVGQMADKLEAVQLTGVFAKDAKSFLMAIGQGSHSLDSGDLEATRRELESLLADEHTVEHLDVDPRDKHLAEADQAAMKRVLGEVLKGK